MTWDYAWQAGPKGGTLSDLDDYCKWVRLAGGGELIAGKRGTNQVSPYRHGTLVVEHKFNTELVVPLEMSFRYTNAAGTVTHADGAAGHFYENKATVERLLSGSKGLATVRRTIPQYGVVEADVEMMGPSMTTQSRLSYLFMMNAHEGSWKSTTQTVDSSTPIANSGNAPVWDAVVDIVGGTDVVVTMTADGATITIAGATPAGGVKVDFGTGLVTQITGGADYGEFVSFNKPYGVILEPGDNAFTTAGTPTSVTFSFYPRIR